MKRVKFTAYGDVPDCVPESGYALRYSEADFPSSAVGRSLDRRLRRHGYYIRTWSCSGSSLGYEGELVSVDYQYTVCYGSGTIAGEGWVSVYADRAEN